MKGKQSQIKQKIEKVWNFGKIKKLTKYKKKIKLKKNPNSTNI